MFQRSIQQDLVKWMEKSNRKPLILRGARQVGKTTVINQFSKNFDQYIYLNLDQAEDNAIFQENHSIDELLNIIYLTKKKQGITGKTLIFIDEIQNSAVAIKVLRYFLELKPEIYVIAAGSLLESLIDIKTSFPVGRVEYAFMYPVSFLEFLNATNNSIALEYFKEVPINKIVHDTLIKLFHRYTLIGGMPEVVSEYVQNGTVSNLSGIYEGLMNSYMDDVEKYARNDTQRRLIRHAISAIPSEAGKRIKFHGFGNSSYKSREMGEALDMLEKAMLIDISYPTTSIDLPISINRKKSPKLHFLDIGLINYFAKIQAQLVSLKDLNSIYKGRITELIVAQELISRKSLTSYTPVFWVREGSQATAEVDFVIPYDKYLIPVEVKSGKSGSLRSLHQFMDRAFHQFAVRIGSGQLSIEDTQTIKGKKYRLLHLPYYLASSIEKYLEWFINSSN